MKKNKKVKGKINRSELIFRIVVIIAILTDIALWIFTKPFWAVACLVFVFWNIYFYNKGRTSNCVDEFEDEYPEDGIRLMFKSWIVLIPLLIGAYFACKTLMPSSM